ncbi:SGNH hydrolase domain-containing protein [Conexibacter arvalis]|uniref:Peptidoglycan/LPS O-acetylase OafA/YrhL n=1 Tax=Conexibacter arvalis TaxID=912552 RepID=A0A840I856_9ACTN|nr:peptidoglycan/LPS O-acetylase OafA/YrhL [Conexibacter arvalis]
MQGIRGFALVLVLLCHAELPFAQGGFVGLDIFFVLSGFLITGLLVEELRRSGTISLLRFYGRRARRLLPLSLTVLAAIVVGALLLFPPVRAASTAEDVGAAGLYVVNWRFMAESVDYFATDVAQSPVQHYWSLSLEEQFYLLWPLALLCAVGVARRLGREPRAALWAVVATFGLASFAYGVWFTAVDVEQAYFSTLSRGWELALGGALALALPRGLRLARGLGALLGGGGLAAIVAATLLLDDRTPYPGWQALIATLATAAFIVAGTAVRTSAPVRLLTHAPFQYLGKISYAWYLWHWPAIVFAETRFGDLSPAELLIVTALAWIPATITHHAIEERFRRSRSLARRPRRSLALGGACTAAAVMLAVGLSQVQPTLQEAPASEVAGAVAVRRKDLTIQQRVGKIRPTPRDAKDDKGKMFADGCLTERSRMTSRRCVYGVEKSATTVVLFGDSHAMQYFPALERLALDRGWRLVGLTRAGCPIADVSYLDGCDAWRENTLRRIERQERPALVVTSSSTADRIRVRRDGKRLSRADSQPLLIAGYARTLRRLRRTGAEVVVLRDQIKTSFNPPDCVATHPRDLRRCAFERRRIAGNGFDAAGARRVRGVRVLDPLNVLCRGRRCPSVIGDALVYRDEYHLSATFAATLAPWLERRLPKLSTA